MINYYCWRKVYGMRRGEGGVTITCNIRSDVTSGTADCPVGLSQRHCTIHVYYSNINHVQQKHWKCSKITFPKRFFSFSLVRCCFVCKYKPLLLFWQMGVVAFAFGSLCRFTQGRCWYGLVQSVGSWCGGGGGLIELKR